MKFEKRAVASIARVGSAADRARPRTARRRSRRELERELITICCITHRGVLEKKPRAFRVCVRTTIRDRYVSHLRCSELLLPPYPALTGWATFCHASGALASSRSIWNLPVVVRDL